MQISPIWLPTGCYYFNVVNRIWKKKTPVTQDMWICNVSVTEIQIINNVSDVSYVSYVNPAVVSLNWVVTELCVCCCRWEGRASATPQPDPRVRRAAAQVGRRKLHSTSRRRSDFPWTYQRSCPPTDSGDRTWRCSGCTRRSAWTWWASVSLRQHNSKKEDE